MRRIQQGDIERMVENTVNRIINESIDHRKEIQLAYKDVQQMGRHLSSIGLRLDDTRYNKLYNNVRDALMALNNALIKELEGGKQ